MKRRNAECGKMRRPVKRNKITDGIYGSTVLYLKFLLLWALVILADFILEFRFEFLWPFWMLLRSVYDSFKYQGLAFSVFFVCIALTSDMICFFFIPVQWVFFAASTYVWVQYVWHTDKGICLPTMILCSVFVYMEGGVRLRDLRHMPAHVDLCRPFAAHCIGYPVVTLGFGLKTYVGHRIRIRRQKQVAKENAFYMQLLQEALPPSPLKDSVEKSSNTLAIERVPEIVTNNVPDKQHMNGNALHHNNNINNHSSNSASSKSNVKKADVSRNASQSAGVSSNHQISSSGGGGDSSSSLTVESVVPSQSGSGGKSTSQSYNCNNTVSASSSGNKQHSHTNGVATHAVTHSDLHQLHQAESETTTPPDKIVKGSKSNSAKQEKKETTNTPREESRKKNKNKDKENNRETNSKDRDKDTVREREKEIKETTTLQKDIIKESSQREKENSSVYKEREKESQKDKDTNREKDGEIQKENVKESHKEKEKENKKDRDRDKEKEELHQKHMEHKENCERQLRQLRAEIVQLRSQNEQLNVRVNAARSAERAAISSVERRVSEERRRAEGCRQRRAALETEVAALRQQLHQARERGQRLERDLQTAEHQVSTLESKMRENGPEAWRTAFNTLRDRAQQLERSLSAETRIKMDLFSAVGEAKRLSGLREGVIRSQEKEIEELKGKIAQMLAVMPSDPFPQPYHMQSSSHPHPHHHPLPSPPSNNPLSNLDPNATAYTPKSVNQTTIKG